MLILTLLIIEIGPALIDLFPSYDAIGVWLRSCSSSSASCRASESAVAVRRRRAAGRECCPAERRQVLQALRRIGVPGRLFLAAAAFSSASLLPDEAFLAWGWRACFMIGIVLLGIGAYIRLQVIETPAFARVQERQEVSQGAATRHPGHPAEAGFSSAWARASWRASPSTCTRSTSWPTSSPTSSCRSHGRSTESWWVPSSACCSSRDRPCPTASAASRYPPGAWAALLFSFPAAALIQSESRTAIFFAFVGGLGMLYGVVYGPLAAFSSASLDTRYRYTALSSLYQISGILA